MSHYIALTCEALARSIYASAADSPHVISVRLYRQGLHNTPKNLRATLQEAIDAIQPGECDAILLAYGICGTSTIGLTARHTPLVLPRTHDCIAIYLGSHQRYQEEFDAQPGTYWYSLDFVERNNDQNSVALGTANLEMTETVYQDYVEKYGQDNADYLMEVMGEWGKHYSRAVFIDMGVGDSSAVENFAQQQAARRGWNYERKQGSRRMIDMLLNGQWPAEEFLVINPGQRIAMSPGDGQIQTEAAE
ncbi:MAG: DUF1638 domain-containing protein [Chloroflexi bacterium]|nr:DUF1638 domain-containing protein [Chloroflexota bacterium]